MFIFKKKKTTSPVTRSSAQFSLHLISRNARIDWAITIIGAVIICICFVIYSIVMYLGIDEKLKMANTNMLKISVSAFDVKAIEDLLNKRKVRENEYNSFIKGYSGVADPSI